MDVMPNHGRAANFTALHAIVARDDAQPQRRRFWRRLPANLLVGGTLLGAWVLVKSGLKARRDGWRRTSGVALRSEASKFALTSFGLNPWPQIVEATDAPDRVAENLLSRFKAFLAEEAEARWTVRYRMSYAKPVSRRQAEWGDVTLARFDAEGQLLGITPAIVGADTAPMARQIEQAIVDAFNRTRGLPELTRPVSLERELIGQLNQPQWRSAGRARAWHYARRILGGAFITIEQMSGTGETARFTAPDQSRCRHPGWGLLNITCRLASGGAGVDLWMQVHHNAADGVPMQEMLGRLEAAWGFAEPTRFPQAHTFDHELSQCATDAGPRAISMRNFFADFAPLLALRKQLNDNRPAARGEVTVAALLLWALAHQPEFAGLRCGCVVDIPADKRSDRTINLVVIRPADYLGPYSDRGFDRYIARFNELIHRTRNRKTHAYWMTNFLALLPARLHWLAIAINAERTRKTFGSLGLTIIRDAKIFLAPMGDLGFPDGFIAIGDMRLPTEGASLVGSVSIKGPPARIEKYPAAIERAIVWCARYAEQAV